MTAILHWVLDLVSLVLFLAVIVSWIAPESRHPVVLWLDKVTRPILDPIRKVLPPFGGFDFSPLAALLLIRLLKNLLP